MIGNCLEDNSLWYAYKNEVWNQKTPEAAVVHNAMRVLRSITNFNGLAYVSVPITSGRLLYERLLKHQVSDKPSKEFMQEIIEDNYSQGYKFVKSLASRLKIPIVFPADMVPVRQEWEQSHFQALWLSIIAEKCTEVHMSPGWEFSNGASEEFTHTMQLSLGLPKGKLFFYNTKGDEKIERERMKSIKVFDARGNSLSLEDGLGLIEASSDCLKRHGLGEHTKKLDRCIDLLNWTKDKVREGFYQ